uniref:Transposase (Putative), gypsy type n=1 Tax=Tanacetum cinerariifolium TaxID=118510 RepID=A0A699I9D2_TANCI|nr:hypothetical protein [Tanacetum cinerariifolium]
MEIGLGLRMESCTRSSNENVLHNKSGFIRLAGPRAHCNNMVQAQGPDITRLRFRYLTVLLSCSAAIYLFVAFLFAGRLGLNLCILFIMGSITDIRSVLTQRALSIFCETYHIPDEVHPQLPNPNQTIHEMPSGISRYYTLEEDDYPEFLGDNDEGMDLLAFIQTADPTKVRVAERQRAEDEPGLLKSTVGRVVSLLLIAPTCACVDRLFDEGASKDGGDADVWPVAMATDTIVEDVVPLQLRGQRKRKTVVADAGGPSHPPKKLREDYRTLGGASTTGKPMFVVQSMFTEDMLDAEARGEPIPTFPFVTSTVSATPEREDRSPADSVPGLNLRTIGAPQRFVIFSDSSYQF